MSSDRVRGYLESRDADVSGIEHAHCRGVHSIVLRAGAAMVRLYYASEHHELWRNEVHADPQRPPTFPWTMSVAVHRHRTAIEMLPILGRVSNVLFDRARGTTSAVYLPAYSFCSQILTGRGRFFRVGESPLSYAGTRALVPPGCTLRSDTLHTVFVPRGERAAWLIVEGEEDPNYDSTCYSNAPLEVFDFGSHYLPMRTTVREEILRECASATAGGRAGG